MRWLSPVLVSVCLGLIVGAGCGKTPDLHTLKLVPAISGYYDDGPAKNGDNRLLPSATFQLKNEGDVPMTYIDLIVGYWPVGADGEIDSQLINAIGSAALQPGQTSEPITVRSSVGYASPAPRAEFFTNRDFKGFFIRIAARRSGGILRLGDLPVDARLLPAARRDGPRP